MKYCLLWTPIHTAPPLSMRVSALAANTLANVTFLGLHPQAKPRNGALGPAGNDGLHAALNGYLESFIKSFPGGDCPYEGTGEFRNGSRRRMKKSSPASPKTPRRS